jgi:hypothetical protein
MVAVLNRDEEDEGHMGLGWAISASWAKTRLGRRNVTRWVDKRVWAEMELGHEEKMDFLDAYLDLNQMD